MLGFEFTCTFTSCALQLEAVNARDPTSWAVEPSNTLYPAHTPRVMRHSLQQQLPEFYHPTTATATPYALGRSTCVYVP